MAEQIAHDVVKEAQSMGGPAPIDNTAASTSNPAGDGEAPSAPPTAHPKSSEPTFSKTTSTEEAPVNNTHVPNGVGGDAAANIATDPATQNGLDSTALKAKEKLVNGDSAELSASEDISSQQGLGETSGGSDTDISRPGSVDPAKDRPAGHLRSNSVKKPASFKSVSVTKNFLAKSAVSTPIARPGEKTTPVGSANTSTQQTAKPRLVAKSGSGIGNVPRSSLSKLNGAGSGPDASKVWNKNQPVPPPPPKQFTDEELKQQYGIHLATRLQADEAGKEAKWADIDDDEDDWAPETVQWMDGTKSSLANAAENQPTPQEEVRPTIIPEVPPELSKPAPNPAVSSQRPSSTTGIKTILKPGAHAQTSVVKSGLVLKGQPEKPTLVAKPSAPAAVKSPWATLPPVDKISPVQINPPVQQQLPPRFSQRDQHAYDATSPAPQPAKEIAPDDFNRSWRDDRGSRELFNSHSGRYEPVNEMRRSSIRDGGHRQQPSVLQRPSHDGPAEPSAAFQTSRTSADAPTWGRRRNSSNVSGGSGRRMSFDRRGPDMPPMSPLSIPRRGSHSHNGPDPLHAGPARQLPNHHTLPEGQATWTQKVSPSLSHAQPDSPYGSVGSSGPQEIIPTNPPVSMPSAPAEDPVEVQKRLMREKREAARLQKQREREEEEKEEAERKERLRKKLEALAAVDAPKPKSKEPSPSRPAEKSPQKENAALAPVQSPPKPPVPTSEGEVAQYGMMKVHQPHPVKKPHHTDVAPKPLKSGEIAPKPSPSPVKAQREGQPKSAHSLSENSPHPQDSSARDNNLNRKAPVEQSQNQPQPPEGDTRTTGHPLKSAQPPTTAWTTNLTQQSQSRPWGSNVWGPPQAKDRALGNGTFESGYNRGQPRPSPPQLPSQSQPGQAPALGLTPPLKSSPSQPQVAANPPFVQQAMYRQAEGAPAQPPVAAVKPGPIAPPAAKAWGNFHEAIRRDDQAMVAKAQQDFERMGGETFRPEIHEIYTDQQGRSQKTLHAKVGGNPALAKPETQQAPMPETKAKEEVPKVDGPTSHTNITHGNHLQATGTAARSSRFFPRPSEAAAHPQTASSKSDSPPPPPPETQSHPAFTGDMEHPRVKMPKPSPRVRLPPAVAEPAITVDAPVSMPSRIRLGLGARPLVNSLEWQARFNSLLDKSPPAAATAPPSKPPLPPQQAIHTKPGALAVAAASKAPLDVRSNVTAATVSLPNAPPRKMFSDDHGRDVTTRYSAEEALLEDREFGSLPIVKPPKVPHLAANEPPVGFPREVRPNSRFQRPLDAITKPFLHIGDYDRNADSIDVRIWLSGMRTAVSVAMAKKRDNRKSAGPRGSKRTYTPNNTSSSSSQTQRPRKPSNYQQGQTSNSSSSPRPSGGNGWNNNRSTPPHNSNSTWARRAAPVH